MKNYKGKLNISLLSKIKKEKGLETDSKSRWSFLVKSGLSTDDATAQVFIESKYASFDEFYPNVEGTDITGMMQVRECLNGKRYIMHSSNGAIIQYSKSEKHAKRSLKLAKEAPELLDALENLNNEVIKSVDIGSNPLLMNLFRASQDATQAIKKATA